MDFTDWRTSERPGLTVCPLPDRAPAFPKLGQIRRDGNPAGQAGRTSQGRWLFGFEIMFCGRDICSGQKRGRHVGKTKRGEDSKIMRIADGHGMPLALRAESASPVEVKLVSATLGGADRG